MILKLYKTNIRPEANVVVEGLEAYLSELTDVMTFPDLKWTQPDLDIMIKLPLSGHITMLNEFNYASLFDPETGIIYYYFIVDLKWKAHQTLRLQLSMDTLNTFWDKLKSDSLSPETRVSRRYFDRWRKYKEKDRAYLCPLIDNHPEDINAPTLFMDGSPTVVGSTGHWTLVYMTEYNQSNNLSENPTTCLAIPEYSKMIGNVGTISRTLDSNSFPDGTCLCLDYEHTPGAKVRIPSSGQELFVADKAGKHCMLIVQNKEMAKGISVILPGSTALNANVYVADTAVIYRQPTNFDDKTEYKYWQWDDPIRFEFNQLMSFSEWYESNKTDPRIIKIIELPYPPFNEITDSSGSLEIPTGWSVTSGRTLKLTDPSVGFDSTVGKKELVTWIGGSVIDVNSMANPLAYETKLFNSNYYTVKFIYDGNAHVPALENFAQPKTGQTDYSTSITFSSSTGMDNSIMFSFSDKEMKTTDFGNYLICNRSTEIPYYNNEYTNYLRYGKAVDERNRAFSGASALVGGIGSAVSTASGLAFALKGAEIGAHAGVWGAVIGGAIGLVSTAIATTSSIARANDQINAKIDQYTHQSSSVSVNGDISLFRKYGKNKLLMATYEPADEIKKSLARYFSLYGYSCEEYGKPKSWATRYWSDYFVISPAFSFTSQITSDYKNDIASRMQSGFRILHRHEDETNHYDWLNAKENWETSLLS